MVVTFATPVKRDGRLYGVISGETLIAHPDAALTLEPLSQVSEALTAGLRAIVKSSSMTLLAIIAVTALLLKHLPLWKRSPAPRCLGTGSQ